MRFNFEFNSCCTLYTSCETGLRCLRRNEFQIITYIHMSMAGIPFHVTLNGRVTDPQSIRIEVRGKAEGESLINALRNAAVILGALWRSDPTTNMPSVSNCNYLDIQVATTGPTGGDGAITVIFLKARVGLVLHLNIDGRAYVSDSIRIEARGSAEGETLINALHNSALVLGAVLRGDEINLKVEEVVGYSGPPDSVC